MTYSIIIQIQSFYKNLKLHISLNIFKMLNFILKPATLFLLFSTLQLIHGSRSLLRVDELRAEVIGIENNLNFKLKSISFTHETCHKYFKSLLNDLDAFINQNSLLLGNVSAYNFSELKNSEFYLTWDEFDYPAQYAKEQFMMLRYFLRNYVKSTDADFVYEKVKQFAAHDVPDNFVKDLKLNETGTGIWGFSQHFYQNKIHNFLKTVSLFLLKKIF